MTARPSSLVSPPFPDRFGRPILVLPTHEPAVQDATWLRRSGSQRLIDRSLQLAEAAIVLILLFVVGEWAYTSFFESDPSLADVTAAGPTSSFALTPHPHSSVTPLIAAAHAPSVVPARTATSTPGPRLATLSNEESDVVTQGGVLPTATPVATATPPPPTPSPTIDPAQRLPDRLIIPSIKLDAKVREVQLQLAADEAIWEVADYMAGHHTGTANPGEIGNMVIAGHRDIRGKVFWFLDKLKPGDEIFVHNSLGTYRYVVRLSKIVKPTQVEVMAPTTDARLTLITCTPIGIASHRLIVVADYDPTYDDSNP